MVCKEKLSIWFKNLSPHKRIDFMCGMLHMCLPMELRFMGSYVEDLARKDFHLLRDSESKANSRYELSKFSEKDGKVFRTKMAVYLALLHSSNRTCSNIIYDLLEDNIKDAFTVMDDMDELTIHNILLVLSMAMHHPAFSYHQKSKMFDYYKMANEAAIRTLRPLDGENELFSSEPRRYDQRTSPAYPAHPPVHLRYSPVITNKVHVCNIEVKDVRPRGSEKKLAEYRLQVTWSNGEESEVFKTYQDLEEFHNNLLKKIPEDVPVEAGFHIQSLNFPVLQGSLNHKNETLVVLNEYLKSLTNLPGHLRQCNFVQSFFGAVSAAPRVQMSDASTSPRPQSTPDLKDNNQHIPNPQDDETVIPPYLNKPVYSNYLHQSSAAEVCTLSPQSPPPATDQDGQDGFTHSPSCSSKMTSPLISSPCRSSASSMESPPLSHPNSPSLQERDAPRLAPVMRSLPQYANTQCPPDVTEQMGFLRVEEAEEREPTDVNAASAAAAGVGGVGKHGMDMKNREKLPHGPLSNGLIDPPTMMWQPMPHVPIPCLPHGMATYPYPPPVQPVYGYPMYPSNTSSSTMRDYSPTNSINSSPSPSPHSSSEESDKDKHGPHPTVNGKGRGGAVNAVCKSGGRCVKVAEDAGAYPAGNENTNSIQQGFSGYASDPTYNAPRPQLITPSYKAQPAHANMSMAHKMYISMPDSNYKPGGPVIPLGLPQHINLASSGNPAAMSDNFQRHLVHLVPGGHTMMNRNYPMSMMNGNRQVFNNGMLPSNPSLSHSLSASSLSQASGNNSSNSNKMYPVSSIVQQSAPSQGIAKTGILINGSDTSVAAPAQQQPQQQPPPQQQQGNVEVCALRTGTSSSVPSTSTITYTSAYHSQTSSPTTGGCSHCGCSGSHSHVSSSQPAAHPAPMFTYTGLHQAAHGMWPTFPNGMVHMPSPVYQYPNGIQQDLLYNMQYGLGNHNNQQQPMPSPAMYGMYGYSNYNTPATHTANPGAYPKKVKKTNCHNCGSSKHSAAECNEVSMEAMSGNPMYSYKPRSDSD